MMSATGRPARGRFSARQAEPSAPAQNLVPALPRCGWHGLVPAGLGSGQPLRPRALRLAAEPDRSQDQSHPLARRRAGDIAPLAPTLPCHSAPRPAHGWGLGLVAGATCSSHLPRTTRTIAHLLRIRALVRVRPASDRGHGAALPALPKSAALPNLSILETHCAPGPSRTGCGHSSKQNYIFSRGIAFHLHGLAEVQGRLYPVGCTRRPVRFWSRKRLRVPACRRPLEVEAQKSPNAPVRSPDRSSCCLCSGLTRASPAIAYAQRGSGQRCLLAGRLGPWGDPLPAALRHAARVDRSPAGLLQGIPAPQTVHAAARLPCFRSSCLLLQSEPACNGLAPTTDQPVLQPSPLGCCSRAREAWWRLTWNLTSLSSLQSGTSIAGGLGRE